VVARRYTNSVRELRRYLRDELGWHEPGQNRRERVVVNPVNVTNHPANEFTPAWSPDGSQIAFESYRDGNSEIYVMDANGSNPVRLTDDPAWDRDPAWSPDGSRIVFQSARDCNGEIYVMNADGSNPVRLTRDASSDDDPAWSPAE
jgi:TolB protein